MLRKCTGLWDIWDLNISEEIIFVIEYYEFYDVIIIIGIF